MAIQQPKGMAPTGAQTNGIHGDAQPRMGPKSQEVQKFGSIVRLPIGLDEGVCKASVSALNQLLADTMVLRDLYKKHHWQVAGPTFYQLHLLYDKHFGEQVELIDLMAERVQILGGISIAMAHDVVEMTRIDRPVQGREPVPTQITRMLEAHEKIITLAREAARAAASAGDDGTNDLLVSDVVRTNEMQVWFLSEHLVELPLVADD